MILGEVGEIYTGWMVMRASVRSNWGSRVNSPAVRRVQDAAMKKKNAMKCSHRWGG